MENKTTDVFETMKDMQKQAMDTFSHATEQFQKKFFSNNLMDSETFKKWYDAQMAFFKQDGDKTAASPMEFFNQWLNSQMDSVKSLFENSNGFFQSQGMTEDTKKNYENLVNMFNNWSQSTNNIYSEMVKNFENGTTKGTFTGMFNNTEMFMKAMELWMPMMKSIGDKSFTPELFNKLFNAALYKEMMDKMFNLQPDFMKNMSGEAKANMQKWADMNKEMYEKMNQMFSSNMPDANALFGKMFANYTEIYNNLNKASSPLMKLMPEGTMKENMVKMNDISNAFNIFNMKSTQMQYMMYGTGMKSMEEVAKHVFDKIQKGEEVKDFTEIYNHWLHVNDRNFVKLFESDDYSKMQADLNSFGMKLKKDLDMQMEKALANIPLVNKTEMNELYQTINELKKRINVLEKQIDSDAVEAAEVKTPTKKSLKN
ncbi:MAG: poly(R)-hydroxyalkanoic acid synthase subunit PhaE [Bacteroidia bacterium]